MIKDLTNDINNFCKIKYDNKDFEYDDIRMACFITVECLKNDIHVDTYTWDCLIEHLWNTLDKKVLKLSFENINDFDLSCSRFLI